MTLQEQKTTCWAIPADLLELLKAIGQRLPELWDQKLLSWSQKKTLFRCLVDKVVLRRAGDHVHVRLVWRGGDTTSADVPVTVGRWSQLSDAEQMETAILRMAREGRADDQIAQQLSNAGFRSPRSDKVLPSTVAKVRLRCGVLLKGSQSHPRSVPGYLTVAQLAKTLNIRAHWIYDRIRNGTIKVTMHPIFRSILFPDKPGTVRQFRELLAGKLSNLAY